jgi:hypothetical protein
MPEYEYEYESKLKILNYSNSLIMYAAKALSPPKIRTPHDNY